MLRIGLQYFGGRGSGGGKGSGSATKGLSEDRYDDHILGDDTPRVSYRDYKNIYDSARSISGTYDKMDKTIQISLTPLTRYIMETVPKEIVDAYKDAGMYSRHAIAVNIHEQFTDAVYAKQGTAGLSNWQKEIYLTTEREINLIRKYGSIRAATKALRKG